MGCHQIKILPQWCSKFSADPQLCHQISRFLDNVRTKWGFSSLGKSLEILPYKWRFSSLQKASKYGCGIFQHGSNNKTKEFKSWRKIGGSKEYWSNEPTSKDGLLFSVYHITRVFKQIIMIRLRKRIRRLRSSCSSWFLGTPASAPEVYCRDPVPVGSYAPRHERRCAGSQIDDHHLWFHSRWEFHVRKPGTIIGMGVPVISIYRWGFRIHFQSYQSWV